MPTKEQFEHFKRHYHAEADLNCGLAVFGDHLAKREKYKDPSLAGLDAIRYYLVHKFHWLPSQVNSMSLEDIRFVLTEELASWTLPEEFRV